MLRLNGRGLLRSSLAVALSFICLQSPLYAEQKTERRTDLRELFGIQEAYAMPAYPPVQQEIIGRNYLEFFNSEKSYENREEESKQIREGWEDLLGFDIWSLKDRKKEIENRMAINMPQN